MNRKHHLCDNFTKVIFHTISASDTEEAEHRYLHDNIFRMKVQKMVAALVFCVDAYDRDMNINDLHKEREYNTLVAIEK